MPLTAYSYTADMTNQRLTATWNKDDNTHNNPKQNLAACSTASLFSYEQKLPQTWQNQNNRMDSGFFDQLSFGDKFDLNNSMGSDKFSGNVC